MKTILLIPFLLCTQLFANYAFTNSNSVKIDMHGKETQSFTTSSGFSKMNLNNKQTLQSFSIKKPTNPIKPTVKNVELKYNNKSN
ncbi:MAG: hypothetical protein WBG69_10325 [Arcobacteraceae bacterium]